MLSKRNNTFGRPRLAFERGVLTTLARQDWLFSKSQIRRFARSAEKRARKLRLVVHAASSFGEADAERPGDRHHSSASRRRGARGASTNILNPPILPMIPPHEAFAAFRATLDYLEENSSPEYVAAHTEVREHEPPFVRRRWRDRDIIRDLLIFKSLKRKWDRRKARRQLAGPRRGWLARLRPPPPIVVDDTGAATPAITLRDLHGATMPTDAMRRWAASVNEGFFGARDLTAAERFTPRAQNDADHAAAAAHYKKATARMIDLLGLRGASFELRTLRGVSPYDEIREAMAAAQPRAAQGSRPEESARPRFSILTPFFAHKEFFQACANSVAALIEADARIHGPGRIEWIVFNDDPRFDEAALKALVPEASLAHMRVLSDGKNRGIARRLNEAADAARGQWLLLLDCDDHIEADSTIVLDHYIAILPSARYISSSMTDIDENGRVHRFRARRMPATMLFEEGMIAGHLVAIRRDLFQELGGYDEAFSGCQDYEFALRAALREPLLVLPEYLYRYRWHGKSQSVASERAQDRRTIDVLRSFLADFATRAEASRPAAALNKAEPLGTGYCIIRTQGKRFELLDDALASLRWQTVPIQPIVVVHGDAATQAKVRDHLSGASPAPLVLGAPRLDRRLGHPMNVALDYLRFTAANGDYFFALDDDDIIYPFYVERLTQLLDLTGADVAVAVANRRDPWEAPTDGHQLLPLSSLLSGNFIPVHCYVTRVAALRASGVRCREDMGYLDDWDFLLGLFDAGARFRFIDDVLCEYRIFGDGNVPVRRDPRHFKRCQRRVVERRKLIASRSDIAIYARDLAEFDFSMRKEMNDKTVERLIETLTLFRNQAAGRTDAR